MSVRRTAEVVPSLFRRIALSRVYIPPLFSRTAVQFSPVLSRVPPIQVLVKGQNSMPFIRGLSISCRTSFHQTNTACDDSQHNTTSGCSANSVSAAAKSKPTQAQRLKRAVKEYGATVIVFHTCLSLFTLGMSYAAVSR